MRLRLLPAALSIFLVSISSGLSAADDARTRNAIGVVASQHAASARARLDQMKPDERADLANSLAWWDENALDLDIRRGSRGQVTHLAARFLSLDVAPNLPPGPTAERAMAFVKAGGLGYDLLALCPGDTLIVTRVENMGPEARLFVFEQQFQKYPVREARAFIELDARGRLTRLDSTLAPCVSAPTTASVSRGQAMKIARDDLIKRQDPLWTDVNPHQTDVSQVVVNDRLAWQIWFTAPPNRIGGHREVLVDAQNGQVIASVEHASFLDVRDRIYEVSGVIGDDISFVRFIWSGDQPCPAPTDPPSGSDPLARDIDETKASLCEAEHFFREGGAPLGRPSFADWIDRSAGLVVGLGAEPGISIGINTSISIDGESVPALALARGNGRAESLGHELGHRLMVGAVASDPPGPPVDPSRSRSFAEATGIVEHNCDVLGKLLNLRMPLRADDRCALASDPDTQAAIARSSHETRDCSLLHRPTPWRWFCDPERDNGGWCEGAERTLDLAYGPYDAYSRRTPTAFDGQVAGHTNLGVGNRAVGALLRDPAEAPSRLDGFTIAGVGRAAVETLYLRYLTIARQNDWAGYAAAWRGAAVWAFGAGSVSAPEHSVRTAHAAAAIWSEPKSAAVTTGPASIALLPSPASEFRPAAASLILPTGVERTFLFYRPDRSSPRIEYVWQDETPGIEFAEAPAPFSGPCTLAGAMTQFSPAAAGRDDALFVTWSEPTATSGVGRLRGLRLSSAEVTADGGCIGGWTEMEPGAERQLRGSPAIVVWEPSRIGIDCAVLESKFGAVFPFRTAGAMGLKIGDCFEVIERVPPFPQPFLLPPTIGPELFKVLVDILDSKDGRGVPSPADRRAPRRDFGQSLVQHDVDIIPLLAKRPATQQSLTQIEAGVGKLFAEALSSAGRASSLGARFSLFHEPVSDGAPDMGTARRISLEFRDRRLVVAFRDPAGALRIVHYDDARATDGADPIPILDASPNATDPALATVTGIVSERRVEFSAQMLYAIYGTSDTVGGTAVPTRLSYRVATRIDPGAALTNASFTAARRIDTLTATRGVRRKIDYAVARTLRTPVVVGARDRLHLFVLTLVDDGRGAPEPNAMREAEAGDRVRYAQLRPMEHTDGELTWVSERPTLIADSDVFDPEVHDTVIPPAEAGAAAVSRQRRILRLYFPDRLALTTRSLIP